MENKVIVITLKGDIKYTIGIDKTVDEVLKEIKKAGTYYSIVPDCSVKKDQIISVEKAVYKVKSEKEI